MDFANAIKVAASGMSAQRLRLNLISSNLANIGSTSGPDGGPYRRRDAIFRSSTLQDPFEQVLSQVEEDNVNGVTVDRVLKRDDFREVYDPKHPDANEDGYIQVPNISAVEEMVDLLQASRTYEANAQAVKALKSMANQALNIGK